ncbi:MAG TPA: hypothetical protein VK961_26895 [Chthoniobacter sp.]|nr:hypothetical protein [Chthoniobacter sp.]
MKGIAFDVQLTSFAHGIAPDYSSSLADVMAPQCVCPAASGQYIKFDDDESFRLIDTRRAIGGDMKMIDFPTSSPSFNCVPHSLGIGTDSFEKERVGDAGLTMLRESKVRTLVSRNALSREQRVFTVYANGTSAESGLGTWTNANKDPIDELNTIVIKIATQTGISRIELVIGLNALQQLSKHPKVLARFPGSGLINVNADTLAKLLLIPVTIHVAMMPIALEKTGKTASKTIIGGAKVYALISQRNPSPFDPSAAKTFTTNLGQVQGVGTVEKPPFAEVNYIAWSEDIELTGSQCVARIDVATGDIA